MDHNNARTSGGSVLRRIALRLDAAWCRAFLRVRGDRPALLSFLFHAVRPPQGGEAMDDYVDPAQTVSADTLDAFVREFLAHGYHFVSPEDLRAGLPRHGRFVFLTFDDGYYNNVHALPVLQRHGAPATFFISTNHVLHGNAFWWDVIYRERRARGVPREAIERERDGLKGLTHSAIDSYLEREFGRDALRPAGDFDRPMTPTELARFAAEPQVHIGNHTADHAILTNYTLEGAVRQIAQAQDSLETMTGIRPAMIAYPNGSYSARVLDAARRVGLEWGITLDPLRNAATTPASRRMTLGRYCFTQAHDVPESYDSYRAGFSLRRLNERVQHRRVRPRGGL